MLSKFIFSENAVKIHILREWNTSSNLILEVWVESFHPPLRGGDVVITLPTFKSRNLPITSPLCLYFTFHNFRSLFNKLKIFINFQSFLV
ncbi:hypothetical protein L2E82_28183 [Cichorium intybus]|uniref:Uncharacterized protein n=1 Tax=Cichorium intybus TaxID=13427 RepID=A0ACB9CVE5_CICIN|nr:hypothetical protein L2E82_28183 [Cichorium intybus]